MAEMSDRNSPQRQTAAFAPGDEVTWTYETRGGWGYIWKVPAYVVKVTAKRVGIAAAAIDDEWRPRWVKPEKLTHGHPGLLG
jgi:hypothetical protein